MKTLALSCLLLAAPAAAETDGDIAREALWAAVSNSKPPRRPSVGLALSGGGARGFAHTGVIQALEEAGFPVDAVSGTSMGSVVGAFYASGMSVAEMWEFGRKASELKVGRDFGGVRLLKLIVADKLVKPKYITRFIDGSLGRLDFSGLKKPFACVAMDFRTGERIIFEDGPVADAVRASVNLPGIFAPVEYRHRYLVDGGVVDFIPVDAARSLGASWVLASVTEGAPSELPDNVLLALLQVIDIRGSMLARSAEKTADFVVKPAVGSVKVADFDRCTEAGESGLTAGAGAVKGAKEAYLKAALPGVLR